MGIRSQNNPLAAYLDVFSNTGTDAMSGAGGGGGIGAPTGLTATGGIISDYVDGSEVYRAHVFTSSGVFDVSAILVLYLQILLSILLLLAVAAVAQGSKRWRWLVALVD